MLKLRACLFYFIIILATIIHAILSLMIAPFLPFKQRFLFVNLWSRFIIAWMRICCGVRYEIQGLENIPATPAVVISKHQSQWETFYLQNLFAPVATVLKKELLKIPFFGWGLKLLHPIEIDRSQKRDALEQICTQGVDRLQQGQWVLIFPEGTRIPPGHSSKLARGGFLLAKRAGVPVLPVAHNAGEHWAPHQLIKTPGKITLVIGKPVSTQDKSIEEIMQAVSAWMTETMHQISPLERNKKTTIGIKEKNGRLATGERLEPST